MLTFGVAEVASVVWVTAAVAIADLVVEEVVVEVVAEVVVKVQKCWNHHQNQKNQKIFTNFRQPQHLQKDPHFVVALENQNQKIQIAFKVVLRNQNCFDQTVFELMMDQNQSCFNFVVQVAFVVDHQSQNHFDVVEVVVVEAFVHPNEIVQPESFALAQDF